MQDRPDPSLQTALELRDREVQFRVLDVRVPEPQTLLMKLHGRDLVRGRVIGISQGECDHEYFAIVQVGGVDQPVVVPTALLQPHEES